jgi:uncharacterized membrane protein
MADFWLGLVISTAICGFIGYVFATKTGWNAVLWTAVGVILNLFGLAVFSKRPLGKRRCD